MNNNNGTDVFGLDNNLEGRINEGWWRIVDGKMIKDTRKCTLNVQERKWQMAVVILRKENIY